MLAHQRGLEIETDNIDSNLVLSWHGPAPLVWWRRLALLIVAALLAAAGKQAFDAWQLAQANPQKQDDVIFLGIFAASLVITAYYIGSFAGQAMSYWQTLSWDANEGLFYAARRGLLLWGRTTRTIPFAQIRQVSFELGAASQQPVTCSCRIVNRDFLSEDFRLTSLGLENREEGLELLQKIAWIMQADGYRIHANTPRSQIVQVWKHRTDYLGPDPDIPEDDDDSEPAPIDFFPIPSHGTPFTIPEATRPPYQDLVQSKADFNLNRFQKTLLTTQIEDWRPGELVRILRPSATMSVYIVSLIFVTLAGGALGYWTVYGFLQSFITLEADSRLIVTAITVAWSLVLSLFMMWNNFQEQELTFDWRQNLLTLRYAMILRQWSLDEIQQLVLSTQEKRETTGEGKHAKSRITGYVCRLDLSLPDEDLVVISAEEKQLTAAGAQAQLAPLGSILARELQVKYAHGPRGKTSSDDIRQAFRFSILQWMVLIPMLIATLCPIALIAIHDHQNRSTLTQLKSLGVDATKMGSFGYNKAIVAENYVNVKLKDPTFLKQNGVAVGDLLRKLPKVGIDIEESPVGDEDLVPLRGVKFVIANLSKSRITDAAVSTLGESSALIFFRAEETPLTDASVPLLIAQPNLKFVFLRGTQLTEQGRQELRKAKEWKEFW